MLKWIILGLVALFVTILVIRVIKVMLKTEKDSKKAEQTSTKGTEEYTPNPAPINIHSASSGISLSDLSPEEANLSSINEYDVSKTGFTDHADEEFFDYSEHMHSRKGKKRKQVDFDLDGDMADSDFEYVPGASEEFNYFNKRKPKKDKKTLEASLNELPTELKVLMLSDIFDRKFFD